MKLRMPKYCKDFHCIADKCKESCCTAGWEIDIDTKTANIYKNTSGKFGEKLHKNISFDETPHFILHSDGKCPFLNDKKLCGIYINLGSSNLCQICKEHPRYYEWFNNIKEGGIGLCCEESARIILSQSEPFSIIETDIPYEDNYEYNPKLYSYLFKARDKIISHLENTSIPFNLRICDIIWYGYKIQEKIYDRTFETKKDTIDCEDILNVSPKSKTSLEPILEFLLKLEVCNLDWIPYLKNCINAYKNSNDKITDFENSHPEIFLYLKNIAIYFIWRYFLKATFDEDVLSKIGLMSVSIATLRYLFFAEWLKNEHLSFESCVHIAKRFSEEIEYSDENLMALADACYELQSFSVDSLMGLFADNIDNTDII